MEPSAPADHRKIGRRAFLGHFLSVAAVYPAAQRISKATASAAISANAAGSGIVALPVTYPGSGATLQGYLARPSGRGIYPAIIIHDNRALHDPLREAARDYAKAGFVVLVTDPLSRLGGTASFCSPADARKAIARLSRTQIAADLGAARAFLQSHPSVRKSRIRVADFPLNDYL